MKYEPISSLAINNNQSQIKSARLLQDLSHVQSNDLTYRSHIVDHDKNRNRLKE